MNYSERNEILRSEEFVGRCRIALCDWAEYWAINGTASIDDPDLRAQTDQFLAMFFENPDAYVRKVATLAISEPTVKDAVEVTDANVSIAVTDIMAHALGYIM